VSTIAQGLLGGAVPATVPQHVDETARLAALASFGILDTPTEGAFDDLTALAAQLCDTPIALVTLVDGDRQWFKSAVGLPVCETSRDISFCSHALAQREVMVVTDTLLDPRFADNPAVRGEPHFRFYAGAPLVTPDGYVLGTLCVLDIQPRSLSALQLQQLAALSRQVMGQLLLRRQAIELAAEIDGRKESERRWRAMFEGSPVGTALADDQGRFVAVNESLCRMLGLAEADLIGRRGDEFSLEEDRTNHELADSMIAASPDRVSRFETRYRRPDGQDRWASLTVSRTPGPAGEEWTLAHIEDITERKTAEQAIADSEANLSAVAKVVQHIQTGADARQTIVAAVKKLADAATVSLLELGPDQSALRVSATTVPASMGLTMSLDTPSATVQVYRSGQALFMSDPELHPLIQQGRLALSGARSIYVVPVHSMDKVIAVLQVTWTHRVPDLDDRRANVVTLLADQTGVALRQAALVAELEALALTDPLTTLTNRRGWDQSMTAMLATARRAGRPLTVGLADLDHFKRFNDTYGHPAGDQLLRGFAESARAALRAGDVVARWGGEEFAFALPDCATAEAGLVLERVRGAVPQAETCSIGYASWDGVETAAQLLQRADQALYEAKTTGRNRIICD
jgi:diguanylate cyclase (GGDEF)-like protein/PAS domain S-box-containing protein